MLKYIYNVAKDEKRGIIAAFLKLILSLLSFIYVFGLILARIGFYLGILRSVRLNCKVISIGNITLGGTGKTPFVRMLAKYLTQKGKKVVILIRGYKRKNFNPEPLTLNPDVMGDEGYLLAQDSAVPVLVGRDRIKTAYMAIEKYHPDIIILDDGFQHWRLKRDLDVVLINALNPFGNKRVIPRGILREPLTGLSRADVFVLTKADLGEGVLALGQRLNALKPQALVIEAVHKPVCFYDLEGKKSELSSIKDKEVCIFSAIADPASFEKIILNLGAKIKFKFEFGDHHNYIQEDLDKIIKTCKNLNIPCFITTEKDAVKLLSLNLDKSVHLLILNIELGIIRNEEEFYLRLHRL